MNFNLLKMKRLEKIDLERLLAEVPFNLLSQTEREAVLSEMPGYEYERLHQLILRSKKTMQQGPLPDTAIRERVMLALRQRQPAQPVRPTALLVRLVQYRLPLWQVAAGFALLLTAHFAFQNNAPVSIQTQTVYVNTTDTIFKEVAMPVVDTSFKIPEHRVNVKPKTVKKATSAGIPVEAIADSSSRFQSRFLDLPDSLPSFQFTIQQPSGRSANEMPELWQFLGEVY